MNFITLSILSALLFAITFLFRKQAADTLSFSTALLFELATAAFILALIFLFFSPEIHTGLNFKNKGFTFAILAGITLAAGMVANFIALKSNFLSKIIGITSPSQIIFGVLLGSILLKESLTLKDFLGILLGITGILFISL